MHLDDATWKRLWTDPGSLGQLRQHLEQGCETCDAFLAERPELDGAVDQLLLGLSPPTGSLDEVGWRRLRAKVLPARSGPRWALALAASVLVLGGVAVVLRSTPVVPQTAPGLKGAHKGVLEVVAARKTSSGVFEQVAAKGHVPKASLLAFRVSSPVEGPARVFLQRGAEAPEELAQVLVRAGVHELEQDTGAFGVALEDEQGPVSVWVVANEAPFDATEATKAITSGSSSLVVGRVEVFVDP